MQSRYGRRVQKAYTYIRVNMYAVYKEIQTKYAKEFHKKETDIDKLRLHDFTRNS